MVSSVLGKVAWAARVTSTVVGLAIMLALVFGVAATALAGTGVGATFNLGQKNSVNKISSLVGSASSAMLKIANNGTGPALNLQVEEGKQPLTVNSDARVVKLNADKLDDRDSSSFANAAHVHAGEDIVSGRLEADRIEDGPGSELDADTLDGREPNQLGVAGFEELNELFTVPANTAGVQHNLWCPAGKQALGGGVSTELLNDNLKVKTSAPSGGMGNGWTVVVSNSGTTDATAGVYVICAVVQ